MGQGKWIYNYDDGTIYHWKYKSKHKGPSGKWVYVYDDGSTSEATRNLPESEKTYGNNVASIGYKQSGALGLRQKTDKKTMQIVNTNPDRLFTKVEKPEKAMKGEGVDQVQYVSYGRLHMERKNLERKLTPAKEKVEKSVSKGIKLGSQEARKIAEKGRKAFTKLFNRVKEAGGNYLNRTKKNRRAAKNFFTSRF